MPIHIDWFQSAACVWKFLYFQFISCRITVTSSWFLSLIFPVAQFVEYGNEGSILLLQTCLDEVDFHGGDAENIQLKQNLFAEIFRYSMERPNFTTVFCEALRSTPSEEFLGDLSKALHLSTSEKIAVGLALSDSENLDFRMRGLFSSLSWIFASYGPVLVIPFAKCLIVLGSLLIVVF